MMNNLLMSCFALFLVSGAAIADTITLKEEAYVKGPTVLLGDVADVTGDDAEFLRTIEITPAALPGAIRRIDAALLVSKVKQAGVVEEDFELKGARRTSAKTLSLEVTGGMIAEDLRQYISREMPWDPEPTIIEVMPATKGYTVADGELEFRWKANPQYSYLGLGTFRGEILVDGKTESTFYAKAKIETYDHVLVANRSVSRGESFHGGNTRLEMRSLSSVKGGAYFSPLDLRGMVAKTTILPGQVVTPRKVVVEKIIQRGQLVPVETVIGALVIRIQAQALSDAGVGETLTCRNIKSKQELVGIVRRDGVLVVE